MSSYKLTRKAAADLEILVDFSVERFGREAALRFVEELEARLLALARRDFEGPEVLVASRARPVRRWPVPPYWIYYDRAGDLLRVLRIYHGAQKPL